MIPPDKDLSTHVLGTWTSNETKLMLLDNPAIECYTMRLYKYDKLISEASIYENDLGRLVAKLVDQLKISDEQIKLN